MDIGGKPMMLSRANRNSRERATIFSIFPKEIHETKVTLFPPDYIIPAGSMESPSSLVVKPGVWWKTIWESNQVVEVVEDPETIARSVINDYNNTLFGSTENAHPGLFYVNEEISVADAKKKYAGLFADALERQKRYYLNQVNFADQIWSKQRNPAMIGEPMRMAARELGLDKEWASDYIATTMEKCPACGTLRDTQFPVCGNCNRVIDPEKYKKLGLVLAEK